MPTDASQLTALAALVLVAAVLYSSVGHAGASGYLAAMALFGVAPAAMKPTALVLNLLVAAVGTARFAASGLTPWSLLASLCLGSVPAAFVGGAIALPVRAYQPLLGVLLLLAAVRLWLPAGSSSGRLGLARPSRVGFVAIGAVLGLLSGLTGIGGGVFLSPILILAAWEDPKHTAGVSAPFILLNSAAGLAGHLASLEHVPREAALLAAVALPGGIVGSWLGARRLAPLGLRRLLAVVLVIAGVKLALGG